jgi:crotonobetainyl-CoA:carnitine CoA-transferase CaiB-like acyl-CoA transferase
MSSGPLHGIIVIDFTERVQGPYATQMLGDFGADVIKVERPSAVTPDGRPDERYPRQGEPSTIYQATFLANNRNKRSIVLDLKTPEGITSARDLIATADVVYENFRPGVMDRLGLGYDDCAELNPSIVYVSASGYGATGPYRSKPGQDVLIQAISGFGSMNADEHSRPQPVGMSITDVLGGLNGAAAAIAAIVHRLRTGEGQHVEVDLLSSAIAALGEHAVHFLNNDDAGEPKRQTVMHGHGYIPPPYGFYATADGHIALSSGRQIATVCAILGIDDLTTDSRFATFEQRRTHQIEFESALEDALSARTTAEWLELMEADDVFAAPVHRFDSVFRDPQVIHRGIVKRVETPEGAMNLLSPAARFSRTPSDVWKVPPAHGQHTDEILAELQARHHERRDAS